MTTEDVDRLLKAAEAYKEIKLLDLQRIEVYIAKLRREKWWLENPEVAYFTARTEWETERWSRESYLVLFVQQVVDKNGLDIDYHAIHPLFFYGFPPLEIEVSDDEELTTYRNPFIQ